MDDKDKQDPSKPAYVFPEGTRSCKALAMENKHAVVMAYSGRVFCSSCGLMLYVPQVASVWQQLPPQQMDDGAPPPPSGVIRTGC